MKIIENFCENPAPPPFKPHLRMGFFMSFIFLSLQYENSSDRRQLTEEVKWKEIVEREKDADKIVFIGDYFDAKDGGYSANRQIENSKRL